MGGYIYYLENGVYSNACIRSSINYYAYDQNIHIHYHASNADRIFRLETGKIKNN